MVAGTNDIQELSKPYDIVSRAKTKLWRRSLRASLAIAATDGLPVTFALEREDYDYQMRRTLINRIIDILTISPSRPENHGAKQPERAGM